MLQELKLELPTIPENIKRLGIDIGLSYDAPNSQRWLSEYDDMFVIGFEPVPANCESVLNSFQSDRFHLYPYAVSDKNEKRKFNVTKHSESIEKDKGQSSFYSPQDWSPFSIDETIEVNCIALTSLLELIDWKRFEKIDIVKVDAQGHDFEIIRPLVPYFDRISVVKLEVTTNGLYKNTPNTNPSEISKFMNNNGYRLAHFDGGAHYYERIA